MNICVFSEFKGVDIDNLNLFRNTDHDIYIFLKNCSDNEYQQVKQEITETNLENVEGVINFSGDLNYIFSKFYEEDDVIFLLRDGEKVTNNLIDYTQISDMEVHQMSMDVINLPTKILSKVSDKERLQEEGHTVNSLGWVDFPSLQPRIIKNRDYLEWIEGKLMYVMNSTSIQNEEIAIIKKNS